VLKRVDRKAKRVKRHLKARKNIQGTPARPRLNVYRSSKHIYAQIIDDVAGHTIASISTLDTEIKDQVNYSGNKEAARIVGKAIAERAKAKGIEVVVFDRGGYLYHGRIKELAEGAREAGLQF